MFQFHIGTCGIVWLLFLFETVVINRFPFSEQVFLWSIFAVGKVQVPILFVVGSLATCILFSQWKENSHRLMWNSLGISTRSIVSWACLPVGLMSVVLLLTALIVNPKIADLRSQIVHLRLPIGRPVVVDNYTLLIHNEDHPTFNKVAVLSDTVFLQAETGSLDNNYLILSNGIGSIDEHSFSYNEMRLLLPLQFHKLDLADQSPQSLMSNGGRREEMELIKRVTLPMIFLFLNIGSAFLVLLVGTPIRIVLVSILSYWFLLRGLESSILPSVYAWIPMFLSAIYCLVGWSKVR
jgi:hypothetical protein